MKIAKIKDGYKGYDYPQDLQRIMIVLLQNGYVATEETAYELWDKYSDSMAAGWMMLPDDDKQLFSCIHCYLED